MKGNTAPERTPEVAALSRVIDLTAVMVRDFAGTITTWSQGFERLYGWSKDEAIGQVKRELLRTRVTQTCSSQVMGSFLSAQS